MDSAQFHQVGDTVEIRCPSDPGDHAGPPLPEPFTYLRGTITQTISALSGSAVHVVKVNAFKWERSDEWGAYDGVPEVAARETPGNEQLEWLDTWRRRGA